MVDGATGGQLGTTQNFPRSLQPRGVLYLQHDNSNRCSHVTTAILWRLLGAAYPVRKRNRNWLSIIFSWLWWLI